MGTQLALPVSLFPVPLDPEAREVRLLTDEGWTLNERGEWIDPASGEGYPRWRAVELARRDRAREHSTVTVGCDLRVSGGAK